MTQQTNGPEVIEQILQGSAPPARDVLRKFESWTPQEQVFACRKALHEGIAPTLRGDVEPWDSESVDQAIAMLDTFLQKYEQQTSRGRRTGSPS